MLMINKPIKFRHPVQFFTSCSISSLARPIERRAVPHRGQVKACDRWASRPRCRVGEGMDGEEGRALACGIQKHHARDAE